MKKRIMTAIITIPILVFIFYLGGFWLFLMLLAISIAGFNELGELVANTAPDLKPNKPFAYTGIFLILLAFYFQELYIFVISLTVILLLSVIRQLIFHNESKIQEIGITFFCIIYITWTFGFLMAIRNLSDGFYFVLLLLFVIWATDTGAYFSGISLGNNKLAPNISPKKSIEGSLGGLLIATIVSIIIGTSIGFSFLMATLIGVFVSLLSQLGDLMESALKRNAKAKDSGNIIPGHGGLLDRFDSFLLAPSIYYVILVLMGFQ